MLEYRLESYELFKQIDNPKWGPDLSHIDFDDFTYFVRNIDGVKITGTMFQKKLNYI